MVCVRAKQYEMTAKVAMHASQCYMSCNSQGMQTAQKAGARVNRYRTLCGASECMLCSLQATTYCCCISVSSLLGCTTGGAAYYVALRGTTASSVAVVH